VTANGGITSPLDIITTSVGNIKTTGTGNIQSITNVLAQTGMTTATGDVTAALGNVNAYNNVVVDTAGLNSGGIGAYALLFGSTSSGQGISSKKSAGGNQNGLDLVTNQIARFSITNGGNVGINNTTPGDQLQVVNL